MMRFSRRTFLATSTVAATSAVLSSGTPAGASTGPLPQGSVGWVSGDVNPFASSIAGWGQHLKIALDYNHRSFGIDFGSTRAVNAIELTTESTDNRLNSRDLAVYGGQDNVTWTRLPGVEFVALPGSLWLYGFTANHRYLKVHCHRGDMGKFTCVLTDLQNGIRAYLLTQDEFIAAGGGSWAYRTPVTVSNTAGVEVRDRAAYVTYTQLGTSSLIAAGKLASDLRDLRFADSSGRELHAFADAAGCFVRIPVLAAGATATIYAYSGNPSAIKRVANDVETLQVQYGRTYSDRIANGPFAKVGRLPNGTSMYLAASTGSGGLTVKYSSTGGRTWGTAAEITATDVPGSTTVYPTGTLWDPNRGRFTLLFHAFTKFSGSDYTDTSLVDLQMYALHADSFDSSGRPIWSGPARKIPLTRQSDGAVVAYALSYTEPTLSTTGAYLALLSYCVTPGGSFVANIVRSTDGGITWTQSADELERSGTGLDGGVSEGAIVQRADGTVAALVRQQVGQVYHFASSTSDDDGVSWPPIADTTVLSSNTQPSFSRNGDAALDLCWSGHNAFGQLSYVRNNLTAAYSQDEGATWNGYHDLLGATELSAPPWSSTAAMRLVQNPDSKASGAADRLFAWLTPGVGTTTFLVEDYAARVRDSHGALDAITFRNTDRISSGAELTDWRWWRSTRDGALDVNAGTMGVRFVGEAARTCAASRLFPGIRKGRVRFVLIPTVIGGGLRISLQEGYSDEWNARGTAVSLLVKPTGEVQVASGDTFRQYAEVGIKAMDTSPGTSGPMSYANTALPVVWDYQSRSLGADLLASRSVTQFQLVRDPELSASSGSTRVTPAQVRIWRSADNATWTEVTGWSKTTSGDRILLSGPAFTCRYLKVSQPYSDTAYTFANRPRLIFQGLPTSGAEPTFGALAVPTTVAAGAGRTFEFDVDLIAGTIKIFVSGQLKATVDQLHPARTVTHLFLSQEAATTPGDAIIQQFLVQDTAVALPSVTTVGSTTAV